MVQSAQDVAKTIQMELENFFACPGKFWQCDYGNNDDDASDTWWLIWKQSSRMDPDAEGVCCRFGVQLSFNRQMLRVVNYLEDYLNVRDTDVVEVARFEVTQIADVAKILVTRP